ncbi:MAG: hypothetical protein Q8P59_07005 [Dehalococcoidia bacterium]|nr:hypothetical protein [Dehalococcoidia bacterium]
MRTWLSMPETALDLRIAQVAWERLRNQLAHEAIEAWDREQPSGWYFGCWVNRYALKRLAEIASSN